MFFLVPVTTSVVPAPTVPPEKISVVSAVVSASPVLPVEVPAATVVASDPPAPTLGNADASAGVAASLVCASSPVHQEDSDVPLSTFLARPANTGFISPREGEDVCPPAEKMGDADGKAGTEKETGKNSKTSPCFSRYLPDFVATFGRGEAPPVQSEFLIVCFPLVSGGGFRNFMGMRWLCAIGVFGVCLFL